jgi:acetyl esterase/lipase
MRKIPMVGAVLAALAFAPAANAADPVQVFTGTPKAQTCTEQTTAGFEGQRWCGTVTDPTAAQQTVPATTVPSFDGTPIDVSVALPAAPAPAGGYPVIGVYHGYGGFKASLRGPIVQRWIKQGYAVMAMTDRGFWGSCGVMVPPPSPGAQKPAPCERGYIHLMSNAWEVHDAQYLLGLLADDGVIDPQRIGATGGSYGGGMSMQLGALKNRVQQPDGTLVPWTSPVKKLPMQIAATAPEYGWSDLVQALMPNGSGLDYAAYNPYQGPNGDRRFGIEKYIWNLQLYGGGQQTGYYAAPHQDPSANITVWLNTNTGGDLTGTTGGGPYDLDPVVAQQIEQFPSHGAYGTDDSVAPAPVHLSNGWNDDLFPVDESLRYYNKVRADHPDAPINMFHLDLGHGNRSTTTPGAAEYAALQKSENDWFAHYVRGDGAEPVDAVGGVTAFTSVCPVGSGGTGFHAKNWASLAQGEVRVANAVAQTIAPDTTPQTAFSPPAPTSPASANPTVCTEGPATNTPGAAVYESPAAPAGGYTVAGAATVIADLTVQNRNDAVLARLYDVNTSTGMERLIARSTYRPTGFGTTSRQVFQLHPQAYKIAEGHTVKLELLGRDAPYALRAAGQAPVGVANLELRIPTIEGAGAAGGQVQAPAAKVLPAGYTLAADLPKPPATVPENPGPVTVPTPAGPLPQPPATPQPPKAAPKDPVSKSAMLKALKKAPKKVTLSRSLRSFRFTDRFLQAGKVSYELGLKVGKKVTVVGKVTRKVTKAGSIVVTIRPTAKGRAVLKAHPRTSLILAAKFTTAIEKKQYVSARVLKRTK